MFRFFLICFYVCGCVQICRANYFFFAEIEKRTSLDQVETYDLNLGLSAWPHASLNGDRTLQLVSPTGTQYRETIFLLDYIVIRMKGLSVHEFDAQYAGNWIFEEAHTGGTVNKYQFVIPMVGGSSLLPPQPAITSPVNGDVVGKTFDVSWTNPQHNYGLYIAGNALEKSTFLNVAPGQGRISLTQVPNFPRTQITEFSVFTSFYAGINFVPLNSNSTPPRFHSRQIDFKTYSLPISFTIIPEPTSVILLSFAIVCATGVRGFERNNRSASLRDASQLT